MCSMSTRQRVLRRIQSASIYQARFLRLKLAQPCDTAGGKSSKITSDMNPTSFFFLPASCLKNEDVFFIISLSPADARLEITSVLPRRCRGPVEAL